MITVGEEDTPLKVKDSRLEDYPPWDSTSSIGNQTLRLLQAFISNLVLRGKTHWLDE